MNYEACRGVTRLAGTERIHYARAWNEAIGFVDGAPASRSVS